MGTRSVLQLRRQTQVVHNLRTVGDVSDGDRRVTSAWWTYPSSGELPVEHDRNQQTCVLRGYRIFGPAP